MNGKASAWKFTKPSCIQISHFASLIPLLMSPYKFSTCPKRSALEKIQTIRRDFLKTFWLKLHIRFFIIFAMFCWTKRATVHDGRNVQTNFAFPKKKLEKNLFLIVDSCGSQKIISNNWINSPIFFFFLTWKIWRLIPEIFPYNEVLPN